MQTKYISVLFNEVEALECLRALFTQALIEEELRIQKGMEQADPTPLISKFLQVLMLTDADIEKEKDKLLDDLWEYSWFVFTSEWAWFRARQEAMRLQAEKRSEALQVSVKDREKMAEKLFKKNFESYVSEINMRHQHARTDSSDLQKG